MATFATFGVALLLRFLFGTAAEVKPPPPVNVRMASMNTNYTLWWDWDPSAAEAQQAVTFTTQYIGQHKLKPSSRRTPIWNTVCEETSELRCDVTSLNLLYLGKFMFRVRADVNGSHSDWVEEPFFPDKDAAVGPPTKVELSPVGSDMDVSIVDPLTSTNQSMKKKLPHLYFHILYWQHRDGKQPLTIQSLKSNANLVTLSTLQAWTWYCVSVQTRNNVYNKSSDFTVPRCMQTEGPTPWWQILVFFLGSLFLFLLLVLLSVLMSFFCYKIIKYSFYPYSQLPVHIIEYFCRQSRSDHSQLFLADPEPEPFCEKVTISPGLEFLEIHEAPDAALPAGLEPNNSERHVRQSSGDSGVSSMDGNSGHRRRADSDHHLAEEEGSWEGLAPPEQVKMLDMTSGPLARDEGIRDMCV